MSRADSCIDGFCSFLSHTNVISLIVDTGTIEGRFDPVLQAELRDKLNNYTILDPPKRLIEIGNDVVKADTKGKMSAIPYLYKQQGAHRVNVDVNGDAMSIPS